MEKINFWIKKAFYNVRIAFCRILKRVLKSINPSPLGMIYNWGSDVKLIKSNLSFPDEKDTVLGHNYCASIHSATLSPGHKYTTKNLFVDAEKKYQIQEIIIENIGDKVKLTLPRTLSSYITFYGEKNFFILFILRKYFVMEYKKYNPQILELYYNNTSPEKSAFTYSVEFEHSNLETAIRKILKLEIHIMDKLLFILTDMNEYLSEWYDECEIQDYFYTFFFEDDYDLE